MPAIIEFPTVVQEALKVYADVFSNKPERRHFAEYLTGLLVAERKSVLGINREFAVTTDQSCLNRWITQAQWDEKRMNDVRLESLQKDPATRYSAQGVIAIDNVLVAHDGKLIEDVGYFWDHADQRYLIAHDYLIAGYVCTSGKHYPLEFRRFRKKEQCKEAHQQFKDHTRLFMELVDWVVAKRIPGDFTFDCYFTNVEILNHIEEKKRGYVGDVKFNRKVCYKGQLMKVGALAAQIPVEDRRALEINGQKQYYYTKVVRVQKVRHLVRMLILWKHKDDDKPCKILWTNRIWWEASHILRVYRKRWTGTETFHRDGKQELGLGDCQLRDGRGHDRHLYLVFVAYSLLMSQLRQGRAREWALMKLTTIGEACRAVLRETIKKTIQWALRQYNEGRDPDEICWVLGC